MANEPIDTDDIADVDALEQFEGDGLSWTVYRSYPDGEPLPAGNKSGAKGPYVTKIMGAMTMDGLARVVGPGTWLLYAKRQNQVLKRVKVTIDGVPWPQSAFNRFTEAPRPAEPVAVPGFAQPAPWGLPAAPPPGDLRGEITTILRNELRSILPLVQPQTVAPPADPLLLVNTAMALAERMASNARPATDLSGLFSTFVDAFQTGMKQGAKMSGGDGDGNSLGEVMKALLPVIVQGARVGPPSAAPPPGSPPQLRAVPPAVPLGALPANPASLTAAPVAAPLAAAPRAWTPRDHAFAAIFRAAQTGRTDGLGEAVDFYLDEGAEFDAFTMLGESGGFTDQAIRGELVAWLGESSPLILEARGAADAERFGDLVKQVQDAITADDDTDDPDVGPTEAVPPAGA